ncbi:MAG: arginine N-succinyltransferase [Myxococcales bacterium]|nr:arginine N-succinyltransferase [Myxococcales bacterium]
MFILRPIATADLDDFVTLVGRADHGLTSLPKDRILLEKRIAASVASMADRPLPRSKSSYLFVLVDTERGGLAGCCGAYGQVGGEVPYFAYELDNLTVGEKIGMARSLRVLRVVEKEHGPAMLGSLLLDPGFRGRGVGRFLSLTRMLLLADHPLRFDSDVIAELRGWLDENGSSPFWDALGRHFFRMPLPEADLNTHTIDGFVQYLLPRQPVFVDMLPPDAQRVIGAVHASTQPAMDILKDEGFVLTGLLDPFEAGPVVHAQVEKLRTVVTSRVAVVSAVGDDPMTGRQVMVSNRGRESLRDYRVALTGVEETTTPDGVVYVRLLTEAADALQVSVGSRVRIGDLPPSRRALETTTAAEEC